MEIYELDGGLLKWRAASMPEVITIRESTELSRIQFDDLLHSDKTVMVVFYAEWCGQCNRIKPFLKEIETELADQVNVYWINVDDNRNLIHELGIGSIPVVQIYKGLSLMWSHTGYVEKVEIMDHLQ